MFRTALRIPKPLCTARARILEARSARCADIRQAVELHKLQEHSLEETAKMMGLSVAPQNKTHHGKRHSANH
jgi:DNA-directed RNA polymerase specialized sigma24 family protein